MKFVLLKVDSPTLDREYLPRWAYNQPYRILENNNDNIAIIFDNRSYWFK